MHYFDNMYLYKRKINTPIGEVIAITSENGICLIDFIDKCNLEKELKTIEISTVYSTILEDENNQILNLLESELAAYFRQELTCFSIPIDMIGTDFQKEVWKQLLKIPYGKTISYQQQANYINRSSAVRAVANANSKNKISIIVPCHRVIGSDGKLTGYAGGIDRKRYLLNLEEKENEQMTIPF